jgi:excinuclease ABC subunit B
MEFKLRASYNPAGDQPRAIEGLVRGINNGFEKQTLLGITGSGKTYTIASVIEKIQKPTLVICHNKTLAAQLCNEFRYFFPHNSVHYFVSYYDYYQPEAYIKQTDTYIRKEALINEEIDKLRHAATTALLTRLDVIVVASVSCIYDLGLPAAYKRNLFHLKKGEKITRKEIISSLIKMHLKRTPSVLERGKFRVQGDVLQIAPVNEDIIYHIELSEDKVERIFAVDPVEGFVPEKTKEIKEIIISPVRHFLSEKDKMGDALEKIEKELKERISYFEKKEMPLEAERIENITKNDLARLREMGFCYGIENYSQHLSGRKKGESPSSLLDYFGENFLTVIDESHITVSQIGAMYYGNKSRKESLIRNGFRLPSAIENRPLTFEEFEKRTEQIIYVSATPSDYEKRESKQVVEQIIRPTGLVDPKLTILPCKGQISDLLIRIEERIKRKHRVLVTTLTKKMAEDLTEYLKEKKIKVSYIHSDVKSLDRIKILTSLRKGTIDVVVGVNLLREGLDLPEVSLVAILDADKEGFLRSETSLIQTIGRAARNVEGEVLLYADKITGSIERAVNVTERRRKMQIAYNKKHGITPKTVKKEIGDIVPIEDVVKTEIKPLLRSQKALKKFIKEKEVEMREAAKNLNFELATLLRDEIKELEKKYGQDNNKGSKRT